MDVEFTNSTACKPIDGKQLVSVDFGYMGPSDNLLEGTAVDIIIQGLIQPAKFVKGRTTTRWIFNRFQEQSSESMQKITIPGEQERN